MQILIFEDRPEKLHPITRTRASCDILIGGVTLYDAALRVSDSVALRIEPSIDRLDKGRKSAKVTGDVILLNARLVPELAILDGMEKSMPRNSIVKKDDAILAARCPASRLKSKSDIIDIISKLKLKPAKLKFRLLEFPWQVVQYNEEIIKRNLELLSAGYTEYDRGIYVGEGVDIHSSATLDPSEGPIVIGAGTKVRPYALLEGPLSIGSKCLIHPHAWIRSHSSIGHTCKIGGEVEACTIQPYSNKQHHGFLGHSYVGSWVNFGAGTTNSDLKNTYGTIKVKIDKKAIDTGLQFFGCVIGDMSKTAINTTILTGNIIGVSSHLYGIVTEPVPSFTNYARDLGNLSEFYLESAIETQKRMFARRGLQQSEADKALLKEIYHDTAVERRKAGVPKMRLMFR